MRNYYVLSRNSSMTETNPPVRSFENTFTSPQCSVKQMSHERYLL